MLHPTREKSFEWLLAHAPEPLLIVEEEGNIAAANAAAGRLCGRAPDRLVGVALREILPDYESAWNATPRNAYSAAPPEPGAPSRQVLTLLPLTGAARKVEFVAGPYEEEERYLAVQLRDIGADEQALGVEQMLAGLYAIAAQGAPLTQVFERICRDLARILKLPMVAVARKQDTGAVTLDATSAETDLWAELQRLPERWDGTVAGNGPAGTALRTDTPTVRRVADAGFMPWRLAAQRSLIASVGAWPLVLSEGACTLMLCAAQDNVFELEENRRFVGRLVARLDDFLANHAQLLEQRLLARALECSGTGAFVTDLEGTILWSNEAFARLSGYSPQEIKGRNPRFLKSGRQGLRYYRELWSTIRSGKVWSGETVERDQDGVAYTVRQTISPVAMHDRVSHYLAMHDDISRQKAQQRRRELRQAVDPLTGLLTRAAFEEALRQALAEPGVSGELILASVRDFRRAVAARGSDVEELALATLGERVHACVEEPHLAACLAPGEFVLLLKGQGAHADVIERLRAEMDDPIPALGSEMPVDVRFGVARFPDEGQLLDELLRAADRQLADQPIAQAARRPPMPQAQA
ncbi:MAG: PAS domain S-box protein [Gammaproteobacteria bacterium]|nr:PAS domain S-box protein [Gammaproteobacteria bacterium]